MNQAAMFALPLSVLPLSVLPLGGCSSQSLDATGQALRRQACRTMAGLAERSRCAGQADLSHERYRAEAATQPAAK